MAKVIRADVQEFEKSKHDKKVHHQQVVQAHRDSLIRQIGDHRAAKVTSAMAQHEMAINKDIIQAIDGSSPAKIIKRPF
jgi:hypothetical protein